MAPTKLTKKQKKGLAFRERKGRKSDILSEGVLDIPEPDLIIEPAEEELHSEPDKQSHKPLKNGTKENDDSVLGKRKRSAADKSKIGVSEVEQKATGRLKKERLQTNDPNETVITEGENKEPKDQTPNQRFILFVGNLKYTTTLDAIKEHFSKCDPPPHVRLLTPKAKTPGTTSTKSKGCAFLEFSHRNALQQGLKLHGSTLDGRRINVELTAGGGGKSESRVKKVQARNKQLLEQRKQRIQKKLNSGENVDTDVLAAPQRHSTTSGMDHIPQQKRTWSVPQGDEISERGGAKKRGKKVNLLRNRGTGANAITVG